MRKVKLGIVGVGDISDIYLQNITTRFKGLELVGVCDLVREKAEKAAEKYPIGRIYDDMEQMFADPEIELILNITRPYEHYEVSRAALEAGKHVYSEKPLSATLAEGRKLVELAAQKGLLLGGAPDTFLGAGIQTCRKLIDDGFIGKPVGAAAFMLCRGHETWHPDPAFYYQHGGGPMLDMGPYYVTALVNLLGGVKEVTGLAKASYPTRLISSQPLAGTVVKVEVPTHIAGIMEFENGATGTITTSFDVHYKATSFIEVYGSDGTLMVPDPNTFGGPIRLLRPESGEYKELPLLFPYATNSRGLGLADMARAITEGRDFRANCRQTLHVLEIMESFAASGEQKRFIPIRSRFERIAPMVCGRLDGDLE